MARTTEGYLSEVNNNLQRIRELTVQGKNPTNSPSDVKSLQEEINARLDEIKRVAAGAEYNGTKLLDGGSSGHAFSVQVGAYDGEVISYNMVGTDLKTLGIEKFEI